MGDSGVDARLTALEQRMDRLVELMERVGSGSAEYRGEPAGNGDGHGSSVGPEGKDAGSRRGGGRRWSAATAPGCGSGSADPSTVDMHDAFWALNHLKGRYPAPGAVSYTGSVDIGVGHVEYQWDRHTGDILDADWADRAERVAALGHPVRLAMLRLLLDAEHTVAQLVDELELASTGVAYHHLNQLQVAGWVASPKRGVWAIPVSRIVPLMTIVIALEEA